MIVVKIFFTVFFLYLALGLAFISEDLPYQIEDKIISILEAIKKLILWFGVIAFACLMVLIWFIPKGVL